MNRWDIFCRVVDNFGDIGTCWRLAQQLVFEHQASVRLWVDNLDSFARLCPSISIDATAQSVGPIEVRSWSDKFPEVDVPDVVVEAFACTIPDSYVSEMAGRTVPPVWINLEYLSAENWVEECHGLASSHSTLSLKKDFFFPGFTSKTGGLLRERDLLVNRAAFDKTAAAEFWQGLDIAPPSADELRISLFCYDNAVLPNLLQTWAEGATPVGLLVSPGPAIKQISDWIGNAVLPTSIVRKNSLTIHAVPFLSQAEYDRLLWSCDVNFVRGEDSFVRAQWAQRPFVWQAYPQSENTHLVKLNAFLARYLDGFEPAEAVRRFWTVWNAGGEIGSAWRNYMEIRESVLRHGQDWAVVLDRLGNLADNLVRFVRKKSFE